MNRQVPKTKNTLRYTIVGDGKVSQHFCQYFKLLGVNFNTWSRKQPVPALKLSIASSNVVLLLISDNAIEQFVQNNPCLLNKRLVHFSGTLVLKNIVGCHPLMTFNHQKYDLNTYQSIPFVCDESVDFKSLFPQLQNQWFNISLSDKAYYHAMCVVAGNFSQTLMRETSKELNQQLKLPKDILFPYLLQNTLNFIDNPENSSTGPIQRGDFTTVNNHLQALKNHPLSTVYQSFVNLNTKRVTGATHIKAEQLKDGKQFTSQPIRRAQ